MVTDAGGVPLAVRVTAANRHDVTQLIPLIDAIPPVRGERGAPLTKPPEVIGDRGYDSAACLTACRAFCSVASQAVRVIAIGQLR